MSYKRINYLSCYMIIMKYVQYTIDTESLTVKTTTFIKNKTLS